MFKEKMEIIQKGDRNGNGMLLKFRLSSGIEIFGLPTENAYGGEWDLGPTWNYLVLADKPFLVDTGKFGMGKALLEMLKSVGISADDLDSIIISHGHEDHDGGLAELVELTGAKVKAHEIYDRLIRYHPDKAPPNVRKDFPPSCWRCIMPESFSTKHCLGYHKSRNMLKVEAIKDGDCSLGDDIHAYHIPGHSPDSLAILVNGEAIIVGDTVLPDITPWPSQEEVFDPVSEILRPEYATAHTIYGLRAFMRSLKKLREIAGKFPDLIVLPAHRLFYGNQWNEIDLEKRVNELIDHHIKRCDAILKILAKGPKTAREIAVEHFEDRLLKGFGMVMAENEVVSHCELLIAANDVMATGDHEFMATGNSNFESFIESLKPES